MSDIDKNIQSDDEYNPKAHKQLLQSVNQLGKTQYIKKPTRSEPALAHDEFHLVKSAKDSVAQISDTSVSVGDLVKVLNKTKKHINVGKELRNTQTNRKVLPKPLERPVAERIQRTIGYEKTVKDLGRWDAVVAQNRSSDNQTFPLEYEEIHCDLKVNHKKPATHCIKSDLMIEMEAIEAKLRKFNAPETNGDEELDEDEKKKQQKLTRAELAVRRKELAYLRVRESQKSAKARLQNKIKSKKFHKLLKREKLKEQIEEFEILQKVNPDAALEKLEAIEKSRVLERANLRHKNTGTWAKNLQVRAKYDKDVRKDLSEQLAISKELTQKKNVESSDEEDEANEEDGEQKDVVDPFNPWVKVGKKTSESKNVVDDLVNGYRKYWTERNKNTENLQNYRKSLIEDDQALEVSQTGNCDEMSEEAVKREFSPDQRIEEIQDIKNILKQKTVVAKKLKKNRKMKSKCIENGWLVEEILPRRKAESKNIDDIFDEAENLVQDRVAEKLKLISDLIVPHLSENSNRKPRGAKYERDELKNLKDLSFKKPAIHPDFDEALDEMPGNLSKESNEHSTIKNPAIESVNSKRSINKDDIIDPNKFADIKPKRLRTSLADVVDSNELFDDENTDNADVLKQMTIAEAFEDDDIVADFQKDKTDQTKSADEEIDLSLPGWGSWAGCGIDKSKQNKRLILKFPQKEIRRDENKVNVYINETVNKKLKEHLVSDLPFPFTCVQDYEASIRAPIGRNYVPETAFRMLTRPTVVTKMGQIIEPMNTNILVKKPIRPRTKVDRRIESMMKKT